MFSVGPLLSVQRDPIGMRVLPHQNLLALTGALVLAGSLHSEEKISFNFRIRPILAEHCFKCHGQDEKQRKAKLRLDVREVAVEKKAIIPGDADASEVIKRLLTHDEDDVMPPPKERKPLDAEAVGLLKTWIAQGAEYQRHWSFIPPEKAPPPEVSGRESGISNPIDAFVLARLEKDGITPAPPADRETWLRRVTMDLTGLPPTIVEQDAFLRDEATDAMPRVVERLLASPAFGERMAVDWLDAARFADTYGRHEDEDSEVWPWRDWVVRAFNSNLPYDQFITWQTAGDLLPGATQEQVLATTFNRLVQQSNESGSNEEEFRCEHVADRIRTNATAFLGLTMECARCHDHKYDPITQKDYYSFGAFLNNIDELGLFSRFTNAIPAPAAILYEGDGEMKHNELKARIREVERELEREKSAARRRYAAWLGGHSPPRPAGQAPTTWEKIKGWFFTPPMAQSMPEPIARYAFERTKDRVILNLADPSKPAKEGPGTLLVKGHRGKKSIHFRPDSRSEFPGVGEFKRTDAFTLAFWIQLNRDQDHCVVIHKTRAGLDAAHRGYEISLDKGRPVFMLAHFWPGNGLAVRAKQAIPQKEWTHLAAAYDGSSRASGAKLFVNGRSVEVEVLRDQCTRDINYRKEWNDLDPGTVADAEMNVYAPLTLGGRYNDTGLVEASVDELLVYDRALSRAEVGFIAGGNTSAATEDWLEWYAREHDGPCREIAAKLKALREEENEFTARQKEIMVMREMPGARRRTYVLKRGQFDQCGEEVQPDVPASVMPFPEGAPRNRLGLARWLVDRRNPLTARVAVNRVWQMFFGRGIVATTEDFGVQGQLPTHPELLDWLAVWFMEQGWNVKELCKLIALSGTYGRSSMPADARLLKDDPDNRLLARGPSRRLGAEQVRDAALSLSGILTRRVGGESVRPYQPAGLWEESGTQHRYVQDHGDKLARRSLYSFWRRTMPPPSMTVFDAPTREFCKVRRESTGTPLQALTLLNDTEFLEAARVLAEKLEVETGGNATALVEEAFRIITSHRISPQQEEVLTALLEDARRFYAGHEGEAGALLAQTGEYPKLAGIPAAEVAAATMLTRALFNYDEFVMNR